MNTLSGIWKKLGKGKKYREEFVAAHVKRAIPHQARALLKARDWPQQRLAEQAHLSQGVVSRAVDPNYGNLTLNTIIRIAAGFDVAFIGRFVPFSELARWYEKLPEENFDIPSFEQERTSFETEIALGALAAASSQNTHLHFFRTAEDDERRLSGGSLGQIDREQLGISWQTAPNGFRQRLAKEPMQALMAEPRQQHG